MTTRREWLAAASGLGVASMCGTQAAEGSDDHRDVYALCRAILISLYGVEAAALI
jgi:hypothetical protein